MDRRALLVAVGLAAVAEAASAAPAASASAERLYVLNCGEGVAGDVSRWSPGVNEGKSQPFSENCYLIQHAREWFLWDTGVPDAVAKMPDGLKPADPRAILWHRPRTLADQLAEIGVRPESIGYVGISHTHPDHVGNVDLFPRARVLMQKPEHDWAFAGGKKPFSPDHPVQELEGDLDVFRDGSVVVLSTPGHTPGHQSLLVHLARTGWIVLTGDAAHFRSNWDARRVPSINADREKTLASMERLSKVVDEHHALLWINHDDAQTRTLRHAPAFYE